MKQPNWKTPVILSVSLLIAGNFAYWLKYSHTPKKEKAETLTKKPLALSSDDAQIAMFKIKSTKGLIELKCESLNEKKCSVGTLGKWTITNPPGTGGVFYSADPSVVKDVLSGMVTAIATETIDLTDETPEKRKTLLSEYGLSDDKRANMETQFLEVIVAGDKPGTTKRLTAWFGQEHPLGDKTFVASAADGAINDKTIFLLSNQFKNSNFSKSVTNFREKALFNFDRKDITEFTAKVTAEQKNGGKLAAKRVNGLWTINGFPANFDHIETVLSGISNAKAIDFVDSSLIKGLAPSVTYALKAGEKSYSLSLYIKSLGEKKIGKGKSATTLPAEKHYYAQSSEQKELVEVEALLRSNIDKSVTDLRNTLVLSETEKVTATNFKVEGPGYSANPEFHFDKNTWRERDLTKEWDPVNASKLIDLLAVTRIKDFVSPPPAGKELFTLSIGDDKNPSKLHYKFYTVKEKLYALNLNEKINEAYLMEDSMKPALPKTENEWKTIVAPPKK